MSLITAYKDLKDTYKIGKAALTTGTDSSGQWPTYDPLGDQFRQNYISFREAYCVPYVYSCIRRRAEAIASIPRKIQRIKYKGTVLVKEDVEETHKLYLLLKYPNKYMPGGDMFEMISTWLDLTGVAYLERAKDNKQMWMLQADKMFPVPDPKEFIGSYRFQTAPGMMRDIDKDYIVRFQCPSPLSEYQGTGPLDVIYDIVQAEVNAIDYNYQMTKNLGRIGGIIYWDDKSGGLMNVSQAMIERVRHQWIQKTSGSKNSHLPVIFSHPAMRYQEMATSPKDMDFPTYMRELKEQIRNAFNIPPAVLGDYSDASKLANAEMQRATFFTSTTPPITRRLEDSLNLFLCPWFAQKGEILEIYHDYSVLPYYKESRDVLTREVFDSVRLGILTLDEAREKLEYDGTIEGGKLSYMDMGRVPVGFAREAQQQEPASEIPQTDETANAAPEESTPEDVKKKHIQQNLIHPVTYGHPRHDTGECTCYHKERIPDNYRPRTGRINGLKLQKVVDAYADTLKKDFDAMSAQLRRSLNGKTTRAQAELVTAAAVGTLIGKWNGHAEKYFTDAVTIGAQALIDVLPDGTRYPAKRIATRVQDRVTWNEHYMKRSLKPRLIERITKPFEQLKKSVEIEKAKGKPPTPPVIDFSEILDEVDEILFGLQDLESERYAGGAWSAGSLGFIDAAFYNSMTIKWLGILDKNTCDTCRGRIGNTYKSFDALGGIYPGQGTDCYTNCRCELEVTGEVKD